MANQPRGAGPAPLEDTASITWRHVLFGGGAFDNRVTRQNPKGWDIFELGQRSFWAVPDAIPWDQPVREDPEYAEAIAAMLAFLCPGEKAAVTGAARIAGQMHSEEAQFYFVEQAMEEAKHYDALRRLIPKITGRPMRPPGLWVRALYSFGVIDPDDPAFMMGSINVIGEHLANQIFHKVNHVATDPLLRQVLALIGKDESRHIAAGRRFFPEVFDRYAKNRHRIMAKNLATTLILAIAAHDLVKPMQALRIDLSEIMDAMYRHYQEVALGAAAFPDQALFDAVLRLLRTHTPRSIRVIGAMTDDRGHFDGQRLVAACERALRSPRELRAIFAA